jgi:hypothetical protein
MTAGVEHSVSRVSAEALGDAERLGINGSRVLRFDLTRRSSCELLLRFVPLGLLNRIFGR